MKALLVISLLLALSLPSGLAASLNNGLLEKYLCSSRADGFKMLVPGSCTQYYECKNGKTQVNTCPKYYDSVNEKCVDKNTGCVETIKQPLACEGPCCGIADGGYAVNPTNHAFYYLCKNNCVAEKKCCENGKMFDLVKLKCDSPKECKECSTPMPPCTTTKQPCTTTTTCTTTKKSETITTCTNTKAPSKTTTCTTTKTPSTTCTTTTCIPTTTCTTTTCTTTTTTFTTSTTTTTCTTSTCTTTTTNCTTTTCTTTTTTCTTSTCTTSTCTTTTTNCTTTTCTTTTTTCAATTTACPSTASAGNSTKLKPTAKVTRKPVAPTKSVDHSALQKKIDHYISNACIDKPNGYLMASLTSCNEYYICTHHRALRVSCDKKYFNAYLGICDLPENTNCVQYQYRSK